MSCTDFCAYHSEFFFHGGYVRYAVMPDLSVDSPCGGTVCGLGTPLENLQASASHEVFETVTDPDFDAVRHRALFFHVIITVSPVVTPARVLSATVVLRGYRGRGCRLLLRSGLCHPWRLETLRRSIVSVVLASILSCAWFGVPNSNLTTRTCAGSGQTLCAPVCSHQPIPRASHQARHSHPLLLRKLTDNPA